MGINCQNTSDAQGFNIFEKLATEEIVCGGQNNFLNIYILKIQNKIFAYDELYEYILNNICEYVFSRRKILDAKAERNKNRRLILDALSHLRAVNSNEDSGAGGELGEILLYLFLEQGLQAPKLFSKIELKTSANDYIKGADGIHFKYRTTNDGKKILQLVIGEAKIKDNLEKAIEDSFVSINKYLQHNGQDIMLIDTHLKDQLIEDDEAEILKKYLLGKGAEETETVFGVFIGYTTNYKGLNDSNDDYKKNVKGSNLTQILKYKDKIRNEIKKHQISNYNFNFYFLPFHDAPRDRKKIMEQLTHKEAKFSFGDIKNG